MSIRSAIINSLVSDKFKIESVIEDVSVTCCVNALLPFSSRMHYCNIGHIVIHDDCIVAAIIDEEALSKLFMILFEQATETDGDWTERIAGCGQVSSVRFDFENPEFPDNLIHFIEDRISDSVRLFKKEL